MAVLDRLSPILKRTVPNHFEELSLVDVRISPTLIQHLMRLLLEESRVKKLSLVNLQHSDKSFESVIEFVHYSCFLKELDLSWSNVRPAMMLRLLKEVSVNDSLVSLSLAYNELLEEQNYVEKAEDFLKIGDESSD